MKISVIMPLYNAERYLEESLKSVLNQTMSDFELICINDASTDNTSNYLEKLNNKDGRFDIMNLPHNIGGAGGFAKGIERSLEKDVDCILIIDDDAMIAIDYMELICGQGSIIRNTRHLQERSRQTEKLIHSIEEICKEQG